MAITICSSPTLPTISLSTKSSLKSLHPPSYLSSPKLGIGLVSDDALTLLAAAEVVALASAAAQAARDAVASAFEAGRIEDCGECWNGGERGWSSVRRKRRRKRRKGWECGEGEVECGGECKEVAFGSVKAGYLSAKEEAEYTLCLKEVVRLEAAQRTIMETSKHAPTSKQLAKAVGTSTSSLDKIFCNGRESRERITSSYRRLVISVANSYQGKGLSLQDLIQEGSIGLLRGAQKFNPERGYKLSTYTYWWIRQAIAKAIATKSRIVRLPGSICQVMPKIAEANTMLSIKLKRLPSHDEIAEVVDMDVSTLRLISERNKAPVSLNQPVANQGCLTLQEIIPGPDATRPETMVKNQLKKQEVENLLNTLCEREASILRLHYGLNGERPQSFEEIGRVLKLSRERVRQINHIAMLKLQQTSMVDNLKVYLM